MATLWYASDEPAHEVLTAAKHLWDHQGQESITLAEASLALYMGSSRHNITGTSDVTSLLGLGAEKPSAYNVVHAITDTKINHTLRNRVRPLFVTEGGNSELRSRVADMQKAVDGLLYGFGMQGQLGHQACASGYIFRAGGIEWVADTANSRIVPTPVSPWEYFVSKKESRFGNPRQLFSRHVIDRDVLLSFLSKAPEAVKEAVKNAKAASYIDVPDELRDPAQISDMVVIFKAWHLPSGRVDLKDPRAFGRDEKGRKVQPNHDGRHIVVIDGASPDDPPLIDVPYPYDSYPVSWFKPAPIPGSYWSRGIPEILASVQIELNRWNSRIHRILELHARPLMFISKSSKLNPAQVTNNLANIFQVDGSPSQAMYTTTPASVPAELINRVSQIPQWAKDQLGMSEMSMAARKPAGVNHEPGMAYLADTETIRHTVDFKAWEEFNLDCAKQIIRCLRQLAENDNAFELVFEADDELKRTKWKDIDVDADKYMVKAWPTNLLKQSPSQRADQVMDFIEKGLFTPEMALRAIDAPDIEEMAGDGAAIEKNIQRKLDRIATTGKYTEEDMPYPYMDLQSAKRLAIIKINLLDGQGEIPARDCVIEFAQDVDKLLATLAPPPGSQQADQAVMPQGAPQAA